MTTPLIRQLTLQNFLSYGQEGVSVELLPLNVLIGPNASGKSNLLEALAILRATAGDLQAAIRDGGGVSEYIWKGEKAFPVATLHAAVAYPDFSAVIWPEIDYSLMFAQVQNRFEVVNEFARLASWQDGKLIRGQPIYSYIESPAEIFPQVTGAHRKAAKVDDLKTNQSILSQRRDPEHYPEITFLADQFARIAFFQEWNLGHRTSARLPQPTDLPSDFLLPDASNLGLVLHDIGQTSSKREELIGYLRRFYEPARYISTKIHGGTLQLFIEEEGGRLTPATRLSDGTLRYLCLLAILCHPSPPPVICIEEPELGLHPDIMPTVAELLRKASEHTQLLVTTHSDALVSALSDTPESILVCEGTPDGTTMTRLDAERLREWLDKYSLGELWRMGEIGGNRW